MTNIEIYDEILKLREAAPKLVDILNDSSLIDLITPNQANRMIDQIDRHLARFAGKKVVDSTYNKMKGLRHHLIKKLKED